MASLLLLLLLLDYCHCCSEARQKRKPNTRRAAVSDGHTGFPFFFLEGDSFHVLRKKKMNRIQRSAKRCFPLTRGAQSHVQNSGKKENKNKNKKERGRLHRYQATTALTLSRNFSLPLFSFSAYFAFGCCIPCGIIPPYTHTPINIHQYAEKERFLFC